MALSLFLHWLSNLHYVDRIAKVTGHAELVKKKMARFCIFGQITSFMFFFFFQLCKLLLWHVCIVWRQAGMFVKWHMDGPTH